MKKNMEKEISESSRSYLDQTVSTFERDIELVLSNVTNLFYNSVFFSTYINDWDEQNYKGLVTMTNDEMQFYRNSFYTCIQNIKNSNQYIDSVYIYNEKSGNIYTSDYIACLFENYNDRDWRAALGKSTGDGQLDEVRVLSRNNSKNLLSLIYIHKGIYCVVNLDIEKLFNNNIKKAGLKYPEGIFLLDPDGNIVVGNSNGIDIIKDNIDIKMKENSNMKERSTFYISSSQQKKYISMLEYSDFVKLKFFYIVSIDYIDGSVQSLMSKVLYCCAIIFIVFILMSFISSKLIYRPIIRFIKKNKFGFEANDKKQYMRDDVSIIETNISRLYDNNVDLYAKLNMTLPVYKEKILYELIIGKPESFQNIEAHLEEGGFHFPLNSYYVAAIEINGNMNIDKKLSQDEIHLFKDTIIKIINSHLENGVKGFAIEAGGDMIVLAFHMEREMEKQVCDVLVNIKKEITTNLNLSISMSFGNYVDNLFSLHISYEQALRALRHKISFSRDEIICFKELALQPNLLCSAYIEGKDRLVNYIKSADQENALKQLDNIMNMISENKRHIPYDEVIDMIVHLVNAFNSLGYNINYNPVSILNAENFLYTDLVQKYTRDDVYSLCKELILRSINIFASRSIMSDNRTAIVKKVCTYIEENYYKDLSLESIAQMVSLNHAYLCRIFKECTGTNFINYIEKTRMEKAIQIILNTDLNITEISLKTGYNSCNYFSKKFRKYTGVAPEVYRRINCKDTAMGK